MQYHELFTMPNATRKVCDYPTCTRGPLDANGIATPYVTPTGLQTREDVNEDLRVHVDTAHLLPIRLAEAETKKIEAEARRIEAEAARNLSTREPAPQPTPQTTSTETSAPRQFTEKRDTLPRPHIELESSESDWSFFAAQWRRYVQGQPCQNQHRFNTFGLRARNPFNEHYITAEPEKLLTLMNSLKKFEL